MLNANRESLIFLTNNMDIRIKLCLDQQHPAGWSERRSKVDYDLWIVLDGKINMIYQDIDHMLYPGDMFLIYPQKNYRAFNAGSAGEGCHILFVHFDIVLGNNYRALDEFSFDGRIPAEAVSVYYDAFKNSYNCYRKEKMFSRLELKGAFLSLFSQILAYQEKHQCHDYTTVRNRNISRLNGVLLYIDNTAKARITIAEMAAIMGVSEKYFITFFKKTIGIPPQQYVIRRKMEKALQDLYEGSFSVTQIAEMAGYQDLYAFSKAFKKIYGVSPSKI